MHWGGPKSTFQYLDSNCSLFLHINVVEEGFDCFLIGLYFEVEEEIVEILEIDVCLSWFKGLIEFGQIFRLIFGSQHNLFSDLRESIILDCCFECLRI